MQSIQLRGKNADKFILVSDEDFVWVNSYKWYLDTKGYAVRYESHNGKTHHFLLHRQILGLKKGDGILGDHINLNRLDNSRENLRICNHSENSRNTPSQGGKSKFKGVYFRRGMWNASIKCGQVKYNLGDFYYEEDAALIYDKKARELFGDFAYLNFPEIINYPQPRKNPKYTSAYIGVNKTKTGKWLARYTTNSKRICVGTFNTEEEAYRARLEYERSI